jgi:hypothetical protein
MKPKIVFFARAYQAELFPLLQSDKYESVYVTLTDDEKKHIESKGFKVEYSFESYNKSVKEVEPDYLLTSYFSDRFLNRFKIDKRLEILGKEISFWSEIFDKYEPIAVINEIVAIEIAEVMYIEANKRGIKSFGWMNNPVNRYFYWVSNPMSLSLDMKVFSKSPSENSIKEAEKYVQNIIEKNERPYYLAPFLNQNRFRNLLSAVKGVLKVWLSSFFTSRRHDHYENEAASVYNYFERSLSTYFFNYNRIEDFNDFEVVLYPLHYEPEASLLYLSEFFSNQAALIENILKCLKTNQVLVVKEHPQQPGMLLTKKYRNLYRNNSGLYYLPHSISSYDIIKKSDLIITLTSHLGWEAMILGKPVYLLGKMFYDKFPQINKFTSFEKLKEEIRTNTYKMPEKESVIKYTAQLLDISYKGMPFPGDDLYGSENIKNIIFAIEHELGLS